MTAPSAPPPEPRAAASGLLLPAVLLGLGLAAALSRELRPARPAAPARSRLVAVLEGVMAPNATPAEVARFRTWVGAGATREGYAQVAPVVEGTCAGCHGPGGQVPRITGFEDLQPLALETTPDLLASLPAPRLLHLVLFPALFAWVAAVRFRRRPVGRRGGVLLGACAAAVLFDAGQAWLRQGGPATPWALWVGAAALALAMTALVAESLGRRG